MITSIIIVALVSGILASIATWTIIDSKATDWYESVLKEAQNAQLDAQTALARTQVLTEEHDRLKQYIYSYVSYLPNRIRVENTIRKEEKKEDADNTEQN